MGGEGAFDPVNAAWLERRMDKTGTFAIGYFVLFIIPDNIKR